MLIFAFENLPSDTNCSLLCIFVNAFDLIKLFIASLFCVKHYHKPVIAFKIIDF